jgi:hypothetical protein
MRADLMNYVRKTIVALLLLAGCNTSLTQIGDLTGVAQNLGAPTPSVSSLVEGEPPITTSLTDATFEVDLPTPRDPLRPLTSLPRTASGGFLLRAGFYEMHTQSYCLKAGTHGPGAGDGYLYAPPKGPARDAVVAIVRNSVAKPQIAQHDIQVLLWAIIARAKFEDLAGELKVVASLLLTAEQLALLNRTALDLVPGPALDSALAQTPGPIRQVLEAEARLRQMLTNPGSSFQQIESVAVLAGMAPWGAGSRQVPPGRWSKHPNGYFVRYMPRGYSYTVTQLWVPIATPPGLEYDPALHIAVPGNTSRQRLIQSGRPQRQ